VSNRRAPADIKCIVPLEVYTPWPEYGAADGAVADNIDGVEFSAALDDAIRPVVTTTSGTSLLSDLLRALPAQLDLLMYVPDRTTALETVRLLGHIGNSDRATLISNRLSTLRAVKEADPRIASAVSLRDPETAKEAAHRAIADTILCPPNTADDELMLISWEKRIRIYIGFVDTIEEMRYWIERGADAIRTRHPDLYLQALGPNVIP
jgi:hypothetical protein